jgi:hypothetical protein
LGVVVLNTNKMVYGTDWLAKMYLAGEEVAEVGEVDIAHTQVDSCLMSSGPPERGQELGEAGQVEHIGYKALRAYHTGSSQRHWDKWGRSVAVDEVGHTDRRLGSVADIEYSAAGNGRIDAVAGVDAAAEAMMMGTAQGTVGAVGVADDVADALTGEGGLRSGVGVDVGAHGERAGKGDVEVEAVGRTYGMAGVEDSQGQTAEAGERWQKNVYGVRTS